MTLAQTGEEESVRFFFGGRMSGRPEKEKKLEEKNSVYGAGPGITENDDLPESGSAWRAMDSRKMKNEGKRGKTKLTRSHQDREPAFSRNFEQ
jgi:hypothetical protein